MSKNLIGAVVVAAMLSFLNTATPTQAALIEVDLASSGDGLLIRDTINNREWLDVTHTVGLSPNFAITTYSPLGFALATAADVIQLFTAAGIPDINTDNSFGRTLANVPGVAQLLTLMNHTEAAFSDSFWVIGYTEDFGDPLTVNLAAFTDFLRGPPDPTSTSTAGSANVNLIGLFGVNGVNDTIGSFLVRDFSPIPEPSTITLFALGLAALGFMGWRRKSNPAGM